MGAITIRFLSVMPLIVRGSNNFMSLLHSYLFFAVLADNIRFDLLRGGLIFKFLTVCPSISTRICWVASPPPKYSPTPDGGTGQILQLYHLRITGGIYSLPLNA